MVQYRGVEIVEPTIFEIQIRCTRVEKLDGRYDIERSESDPFAVALVLKDPPELPPWIQTNNWTKSAGRADLFREHQTLLKKQIRRPIRGVDFSDGCGERIGRTEVRWDKEHPSFAETIKFLYNPAVKNHYITFQIYDCDHFTEPWDKDDPGHLHDKLVDDLEYQTFINQRTFLFEDILNNNKDLKGDLKITKYLGRLGGELKLTIFKSNETVELNVDENDISEENIANLTMDGVFRTSNKLLQINKLKKSKRKGNRRRSIINADIAALKSDITSSKELTASLDNYSLNFDYFQSWSTGKHLFTLGVPESKYSGKNLNLQVIDLESKKINKDIDQKILGTGDIPCIRRGFNAVYKPESKEVFLFGGVIEKNEHDESHDINENKEGNDTSFVYDDSI